MKCPSCKGGERFTVMATAQIELDKNGNMIEPLGYDWGTTSYCACRGCGYDGRVEEFTGEVTHVLVVVSNDHGMESSTHYSESAAEEALFQLVRDIGEECESMEDVWQAQANHDSFQYTIVSVKESE